MSWCGISGVDITRLNKNKEISYLIFPYRSQDQWDERRWKRYNWPKKAASLSPQVSVCAHKQFTWWRTLVIIFLRLVFLPTTTLWLCWSELNCFLFLSTVFNFLFLFCNYQNKRLYIFTWLDTFSFFYFVLHFYTPFIYFLLTCCIVKSRLINYVILVKKTLLICMKWPCYFCDLICPCIMIQ